MVNVQRSVVVSDCVGFHVIVNNWVDILAGVKVGNGDILMDENVGAVYSDVVIDGDYEVVIKVIIIIDNSYDVLR